MIVKIFTLCTPYVLYRTILNFILQGGGKMQQPREMYLVGNYCDYCDKFEYMLSISSG